MDSKLEKILKYFIYFFPPLLLTGPFLPDLILSISVIVFLTLVFLKKNFYIFKNFYFKVFLAFLLYLILRSIFTLDFLSIRPSIFYFRFGFFSLAIFYLLQNKLLSLKIYTLIIFLTLLALYIDGSIQFLTGKNILGIETYHPERISSFFKDELILGGVSFRVFVVLVPLFYFLKLKNRNTFSFFVIIMICSLILYSSERTAVLLMLSFLIIFLLLLPLKLKLKILLVFVITSMIVVFFYFSETSRNRIINKTIDTVKLNISTNVLFFSTVHSSHMLTGINMFKDNIIFGKGPKMYRKVCDDKNYEKFKVGDHSCTTHPHNILVQFLAETGLIGLLFLIIFYYKLSKIFFTKMFLKNKNECEFSILILSSITILNFFPFLPSGNFFNNWLSMISYLPIPFLMFIYNDCGRANKQ